MTFNERLGNIRHTPVDIAIAAALVLLGLPLLLGLIAGGGAYLYFFKFSPPVAIPEPSGVNIARSSHIYAADGTLLATLRGANFRVPIDYSEMPATSKGRSSPPRTRGSSSTRASTSQRSSRP